jgi:hypothetical protein
LLVTFEDYIYRDGQPLASFDSNNVTRHFHLDHLGSVRRISSIVNGAVSLAAHDLWPYGEEYLLSATDERQMRCGSMRKDLGV